MGEGEFYTGLVEVATLPSDAELVNVSDSPPTRYPIKEFVDRVMIESAIHDRAAGTLTVRAKSSDPDAKLTIPQLNDLKLTGGTATLSPTAAVPAEIIVTSDRGGEGRQLVEVTGSTDASLPVEVNIVPVLRAFTQDKIELDGSGSLGATAFTWTQTAGPSISLADNKSAKIAFTPTQAGNYTFQLKVQGDGGAKTTSISFTVTDPGPDDLTVTLCQYRTSKEQFLIGGSVKPTNVPNEIIVTYKGEEIGRGIADIEGNWSVKTPLTDLKPELDPLNNTDRTITVKSKRDTEQQDLIFRN